MVHTPAPPYTKSAYPLWVWLFVLVWMPAPNAIAGASKLDFQLLYHVAQLADQAYEGRSEVLGRLSNKNALVITPGSSNVQYVLNFNHRRKIQVISIRGTVDDTNLKIDMDTYGVHDRKAGILLHRGFRKAALEIYADLKPRLRRGYRTYLTGHSLGGAVAAILAIYLSKDAVNLGETVTFGQPMFTNLAGAQRYRNLQLLRVVYQNDVVSLWPERFQGRKERFAHTGAILNLLPGPYYVFGTSKQGQDFSVGSLGRLLGQISVPDHKMKWYMQGLRDKISNAKQISVRDRERYVVRNKPGRGIETEPPRRRFNFNHHK